MKAYKTLLRIWIAGVSMFSFVAGWVFFAHSNKPAPLQQTPPAQVQMTTKQPTWQAPLRSQPGWQMPSIQLQPSFSRPRLRTGGS
jgi:hypothetical protein